MTIRERDRAVAFVQFCNELQAANVRFGWGSWDCNTFVLAWLDRMAGTDYLSQYQGKYSDLESARAFQETHGRTLFRVCLDAGLMEVPGGARFAQPGDVLLVDDPGEPWRRGHVCGGTNFASIWPGRGLDVRPMMYMPKTALTMRYC
jgi:hypothetical protein